MKKMLLTCAVCLLAAALQAKTLIVYYSYTNNVHQIVTDLQTQIDADVIRVEPAEEGLDYAANNYAIGSALISAIRNDPDNAASYPAIKNTAPNLKDYDTILIGAPLWWSNMAAPLQSFLFAYGPQMADKHIGLIVSSASSGISGVEADAKRLIPDGNFLSPSLWIRSSETRNCHSMIARWLEDIDYQGLSTGITQINTAPAPALTTSPGLLQVNGPFQSLTLFCTDGQRVMQTSDRTVTTAHLNSGLYIAQVTTENRAHTYKVCIRN